MASVRDGNGLLAFGADSYLELGSVWCATSSWVRWVL